MKKFRTIHGKRVPLRGGLATQHKKERDGSSNHKGGKIMPAKGSLFGSDKLGSFDSDLEGRKVREKKNPRWI